MRLGRVSLAVPVLLIAVCTTAAAQTPIRVRTSAELQSAFSRVANGGVIEAAAGTYRAPGNGFNVSNLRKSFTVRAAPGATVVLDGEGKRPVLRFKNRNRAQNKAITFEGLTFANGLATANNDAGGVGIAAAEARFVGCVFRGNRSNASSTGGGAVKVYDGSQVTFSGCGFRGNAAKNRGGAISMRSSTVSVQGGLFINNRVNLAGHNTHSAGGAIYVLDGILRVSGVRFEKNQAGWVGGAIYAIGNWAGPADARADVLVTRSTFADNQALSDRNSPAPGPTTGGALHAENQTTMKVQTSSFLRNEAEFGGAINAYRAILEVEGSIFQGNQATLNSDHPAAGGAILALSNDEPGDAANRRSVRLKLTDSLFQGRLGASPAAANVGGCVLAAGDESRMYGSNGIAQAGTLAANRASVEIRNVIFSDCDVVTGATGNGGSGGALEASLVDLTMEDSFVLDCDAVATQGNSGGYGGGISLQNESNARIARTTLAGNTAQSRGGALSLSGSQLQMTQSNFFGNDAGTDQVSNSRGAAIFTSPLLAASRPRDVGGVISDSVFSDNRGLPIWEVEPESGPINDVRYEGNRIYSPVFGDLAYVLTLTDPGRRGSNVGELNSLVVHRPGRPSTDKSTVPNQRLTSPPRVGVLFAAPLIPRAGAPGATVNARLGFAWSGRNAALDGQPLTDRAGLAVVAAPGQFTLAVDGSPAATVRVGPP